MTKNVASELAKGAIWMVLLRLSIKGIGLVSTIVLARLLSPDDFGLMAIAGSIYAFIILLNAFGLDSAIIQNQNANERHYNTAWTIQVVFGLLASFLLIVVSEHAANYFSDNRLKNVLLMMSLIFFVNGFKNIGVVDFRKKMEFNREFKFQLAIKLASFCTVIPLAVLLESFWALLWGMLASSLASVLFSFTMQTYRPSFTLSALKELFGFSSWLFLNNCLIYLSTHTQALVLGKIYSPKEVGVYSISNELATITSTELVASINRAAFPAYSKVANEKRKLKDLYLKTISYLVAIAAPCCMGLAVTAPLLIPVVLGGQWREAIPIIQVLAIANVLVSINTNSGYVYLALGRQKLSTLLMTVQLCVFLPLLFILTSKFGLLGAAQATLITTCISFPLNYLILYREINISFWIQLKTIQRPIVASLVMYFAVEILISKVDSIAHPYLSLLACIFFGILIYLSVLFVLWSLSGKPDSPEKFLLTYLQKKMLRLKSRKT